MKKIVLFLLIFSVLCSGICFAEKSKLKKKTWTPVQVRTENKLEVQDFYNHKELHHEGAKQVGLWFVTFIPDRDKTEYSYFYEAVVFDFSSGRYRMVRTYQANKKNKIDKGTDKWYPESAWEPISGTKYEALYRRMKPSIW